MAEVDDGYDDYYANRLWQMLPGIYRSLDSETAGVAGPLQEMVNRIATQVAVVRRSIDRLWADQSIETCDDWVIPYIGDLLGTNLVRGDPRGQRLDVANTIHYRRSKGTLAVLEEIARDVTGWDAHVVEGFRRLSRTRHNLDPAVGVGPLQAALPAPCPQPQGTGTPADPSGLLRHEQLVGLLSGTPAGGFADLRSLHAATLADSPFDEFFHTADMRMGQGAVGRYGIQKLLVFLWRLQSFTVNGGTPVGVSACQGDNQYVFDPTGRRVPLFLLPLQPEPDDDLTTWVPEPEWDVPGPLSSSLLQAMADSGGGPPPHAPYPGTTDVPSPLPAFYSAQSGAPLEPLPIEVIWPELGQFRCPGAPGNPLMVTYQYGFPAAIGAGPYDRTVVSDPPMTIEPETVVAGGTGLDQALTASKGAGTVTVSHSLTYSLVANVGSTAAPITSMLVRAGAEVRPVVRLPAPSATTDPPVSWLFTGGGEDACLTLDGLFVSGGDIVLRGAFETVRLTGCTMDPGTLTEAGDGFATSVDDRPLTPVRIWIEADPGAAAGSPGGIGQLTIDHCVLGPIRTRNGGAVDKLTICDSTIQGAAPAANGPSMLSTADVYDPALLVTALASGDPASQALLSRLPAAAQRAVQSFKGRVPSPAALSRIVAGLQALITGPSIYSPTPFVGVSLSPELSTQLAQRLGTDQAAINLALLQAIYPVPLGVAALALSQGTVNLERVTVMGSTFVHRLQASDTILNGFTVAEDTQDGCIRFSAVTKGSFVPRQFSTVTIATDAPLFTSASYGDPGYGQLLETADQAIVGGTNDVTITSGASSGSEMGAYSEQLAPINEQGLLIKYGEYMPLGLTPVVIHVT